MFISVLGPSHGLEHAVQTSALPLSVRVSFVTQANLVLAYSWSPSLRKMSPFHACLVLGSQTVGLNEIYVLTNRLYQRPILFPFFMFLRRGHVAPHVFEAVTWHHMFLRWSHMPSHVFEAGSRGITSF